MNIFITGRIIINDTYIQLKENPWQTNHKDAPALPGPSLVAKPGESQSSQTPVEKKETLMTARVGQKAPDFTAPSYYKGGFTPVKLSDFAGKWVLVCFYPGDFTFV